MSGPLIEKLKTTVIYNAIKNVVAGGVSDLRRLPQVCSGLNLKLFEFKLK